MKIENLLNEIVVFFLGVHITPCSLVKHHIGAKLHLRFALEHLVLVFSRGIRFLNTCFVDTLIANALLQSRGQASIRHVLNLSRRN